METEDHGIVVRVWHLLLSDDDQGDGHKKKCYDGADKRPTQRRWFVVWRASRPPYGRFPSPRADLCWTRRRMVVFCGLDGVFVCGTVVSRVDWRLLHVFVGFAAVGQHDLLGSESEAMGGWFSVIVASGLATPFPSPHQGRHRVFGLLPHTKLHEASTKSGMQVSLQARESWHSYWAHVLCPTRG